MHFTYLMVISVELWIAHSLKYNLWGLVLFGRFECSKFDLRKQTLICKVQCLRSSRFVIFGLVPSLAFLMHSFIKYNQLVLRIHFLYQKLTSLYMQPLDKSCIFILVYLLHYKLYFYWVTLPNIVCQYLWFFDTFLLLLHQREFIISLAESICRPYSDKCYQKTEVFLKGIRVISTKLRTQLNINWDDENY